MEFTKSGSTDMTWSFPKTSLENRFNSCVTNYFRQASRILCWFCLQSSPRDIPVFRGIKRVRWPQIEFGAPKLAVVNVGAAFKSLTTSESCERFGSPQQHLSEGGERNRTGTNETKDSKEAYASCRGVSRCCQSPSRGLPINTQAPISFHAYHTHPITFNYRPTPKVSLSPLLMTYLHTSG
jgi:hypothetical protein